jgi:hypothetical protein
MDRAALIAAMAATPLEVRHVTVPGWGDLHVRELTTDVVDRLNRAKRGDDEINALALSAAATICDEQGVLLFDVGSSEDVKLLAAQGFGRLSLVLKAANSLAAEDTEAGNA